MDGVLTVTSFYNSPTHLVVGWSSWCYCQWSVGCLLPGGIQVRELTLFQSIGFCEFSAGFSDMVLIDLYVRMFPTYFHKFLSDSFQLTGTLQFSVSLAVGTKWPLMSPVDIPLLCFPHRGAKRCF